MCLQNPQKRPLIKRAFFAYVQAIDSVEAVDPEVPADSARSMIGADRPTVAGPNHHVCTARPNPYPGAA
jgi:hypothetical protein